MSWIIISQIFTYSRKTWQDQDHSLQAETSPDSLASAASTSGAGPEVKYEGFTEFNYNNKPNVNLSWKSYEFSKVKFYLWGAFIYYVKVFLSFLELSAYPGLLPDVLDIFIA